MGEVKLSDEDKDVNTWEKIERSSLRQKLDKDVQADETFAKNKKSLAKLVKKEHPSMKPKEITLFIDQAMKFPSIDEKTINGASEKTLSQFKELHDLYRSLRNPYPKETVYKKDIGSERYMIVDTHTEDRGIYITDENRHDPKKQYGSFEEAITGLERHIEKEAQSKRTDTFKSSHFDEPNVLAHTRINERIDSEGKRVLFVEEIQSDWHQAGRKKGYRGDSEQNEDLKLLADEYDKVWREERSIKKTVTIAKDIAAAYEKSQEAGDIEALSWGVSKQESEKYLSDETNSRLESFAAKRSELAAKFNEIAAEKNINIKIGDYNRDGGNSSSNKVPDAPFKKTWHEFVMKRMIRYAAENGFDKIAWTTGEQQAERYDLSKQVDEISATAYNDGSHQVIIKKDGRDLKILEIGAIEEAEDWIGKEATQKLKEKLESGDSYPVLKGLDLKVGGEGMKGFYDKMLVDFANKFTKKYGARVSQTEVEAGQRELDFTELKQTSIQKVIGDYKFEDFKKVEKDSDDFRTVYEIRGRETLDRISYTVTNDDGKVAFYSSKTGPERFRSIEDFKDVAFGKMPDDLTIKEKVHSLEITPQLKEAALNEGFSLFQDSNNAIRGRIKLNRSTGFKAIELFQHKDMSTLLHESGHLWLDELIEDGTTKGVNEQVTKDLDTMLEMFELDVRAKDGAEAIRRAITTEHHEKFARSVEAYFMQGKAPTDSLRRIFSKFKIWLIAIYKDLGALNAFVHDDVKQVFDRMIATQEEIDRTEAENMAMPMFPTPENYGLTGKKAEAYRQAVDDAREAAEKEVQVKAMEDYLREKEQWWKEEKAAIASEIEADLNQKRGYRVLSILQKGVLPDGSPAPEGLGELKLNKKDLDVFGKDFHKSLPKGITSKDGMNHELVAEAFGYSSAQDMISELGAIQPKNKAVAQQAEAKMREKYPNVFADGTIKQVAEKAIHNADRGKLLRMELEHIISNDMPVFKDVIKKTVRRVPSEKVMREQAVQILKGKTFKELSPIIYRRAEVKAAKDASNAIVKGDFEATFEAKRRELLNYELFRAATAARESYEKADVLFKKFNRKNEDLAKTRDMDLINAGRSILALYGIGTSEKPASEYLASMKKYDPEMYENMLALVEAASEGAKNFEEVTYDQFTGLVENMQAIWDLSKSSRQIEIDGKVMDKQEAIDELKQQLVLVTDPKEMRGYKKQVSDWDKVKLGLLGVKAALRRVESWANAIDGQENGVFQKYIVQPVMAATANYRMVKKPMLEKFLEVIKPIEKSLVKKDIKADELGYTFSGKAELLGAILHTGNASNLEKLLIGRGWAIKNEDGSLDRSRWDRFINRMQNTGVLTKADYDVMQNIWDLFESTKPLAQKAHKQMYGYYFNEVTADAFQTPYGNYRGGYAPAIVDPFVSNDALVRNDKDALSKNNNSFMFPTTGRGFTKSRVEQYSAPLMMDLTLVPMQLDKVLRFIHIEPSVKQVSRIVMDKKFRKDLDHVDAAVATDMLVPWLQRAAQQSIITPTQGVGGRAVDAFFKGLRTRTGMQVMVGNLTNAMQQVTGLSIAALKVKPKYLRNALWSYVRAPGVMAEDIAEKSKFMKTRLDNSSFEIQSQIEDMLLNPSKYEKLRDFATKHGYFLQSGTQSFVDVITWTGSYDQAVEQGSSEADAVKIADSAVRQTQGSFNAEDVSRYETGSPFARLFTMFYSYFNMQANLLGTEFTKNFREMGLKKGAGRAFYIYTLGFMIPAVISELIVKTMAGKIDADDDDEYMDDFLMMFFGSQFRSGTALFPVVGPLINASVNAFNDKAYDDRVSTSPVISTLESAVSAPHSVYSAIVNDGSKKKAIRDTLTAIGLVTGAPLTPLSKPLGYMADVSEGKANPTGPVDYTRGLVTGKPGN
jgi:hypothetical protein